jgi:hypothetical protein
MDEVPVLGRPHEKFEMARNWSAAADHNGQFVENSRKAVDLPERSF